MSSGEKYSGRKENEEAGVVGGVQGRPPRADSDRDEEPSRPRGEHRHGHVSWGWAAASRSLRLAQGR